ncbi:hypothetical protein LTR01_004541 [Friedmanniomyces endolithicus]|nr:hypothetical protein LTR01_004541 [Friedmanniomyces endolithicus]KAK0833185.1 hypothetical protein LTR73_002273 [Friedmanniomyces endolithicus]
MPVSAIDSLLFRNLFGTAEIRALFSDKTYIQRCLDVEAALARSQSKLNIIPPHAGEAITRACANLDLDYDRLSDETEIVGYPILPLVRQLTTACGDGEAGKYVHWGATTQDIQDTATVLQMKAGLEVVEAKLRAIVATLGELAKRYRDTPMAGRTHLQHALPRHLERLGELRPRALVVQFGGAAGTLASLGDGEDGLRVRRALAEELGLGDPVITWHTARDGVAETVNFLALVGGSLGKLAMDLMVMSSNELGEVSEPFVPHRGASSTMPQKRNPISSEVILAASKILRANAGLCLDAMITDFERASGPWHLEWVAVPESFVVAVGALSQAGFVLSGLVVNTQQMERNLDSSRGLIVAEAVMMDLASHIGRQQAHDLIYDACNKTIEAGEGTSLFDVLVRDERVTGAISKENLAELCKPANYLGAAGRMVDDVLACRAGSLS